MVKASDVGLEKTGLVHLVGEHAGGENNTGSE